MMEVTGHAHGHVVVLEDDASYVISPTIAEIAADRPGHALSCKDHVDAAGRNGVGPIADHLVALRAAP